MLKLLKEHKNFLFYCLLITFCSGIGQTYLLALFNEPFQERLAINSKQISYYYSLATFIASLFLPIMGRFIDTIPFRKLVLLISFSLGLSIALLGYVNSIWQLILAYILVRLLGQSTLPLTSSATISKHFGMYRGKALAIASLGRSIAEGILPLLVISSLNSQGLTGTFLVLAFIAWALLIPTSFLFLRNVKLGAPLYPENETAGQVRLQTVNFKSVYFDIKVYLLSLSNILLPFLLTGVYFHVRSILEVKGWSIQTWAQSFLVYAICMVGGNFATGFLVDRYGAHRIILFKFVPTLLAVSLFYYAENSLMCYGILGLFGMSVGLSTNAKSALLAELFGGTILATIKSIDAMLMVISTSISPILFSHFIESYGVLNLFKAMFIHTSITGVLLFLVIRKYKNSNRI